MNADSLFQKLHDRSSRGVMNSSAPEEDVAADSVDDQGAYGILRAPRERAFMLELRKKDGAILAVPYAMIEKIDYSPTAGIILHACGHEIKIAGRQLNAAPSDHIGLWAALVRHRLVWVQEYARTAAAQSHTTQVDTIQW